MDKLYSLPSDIKHNTLIALSKANPFLEEPEIHQAVTTYFTPHIFKLKNFHSDKHPQLTLYLTLSNFESELIPYDPNRKQIIKDEIDDLTQIIFSYDFPIKSINDVGCNAFSILNSKKYTQVISQKNRNYIETQKGSELVIYANDESLAFGKHVINLAFEKYPVLEEEIISNNRKGTSKLFSLFGSLIK